MFFDIYFLHILHIILHIFWHILHVYVKYDAECGPVTILHIFAIFCVIFCI